MAKSAAGWFVTSCGLLLASLGAIGVAGKAASAGDTASPPVASNWVPQHASRVRLVAGSVARAGEPSKVIYAGLEIELDQGWKTYWRNPGTSGVPPRIELNGSQNLEKAELMFPAPLRFKDSDGDTIGYKKHVVLPVALTPKDATKPIVLKVSAELGICRDVCVPLQPVLGLTVPPDAGRSPENGPLRHALDRVPQAARVGFNTPRLKQVKTRLSGAQPQVVIDAHFPGPAGEGDVFLEAPDGIWIPLPQPNGKSEDGGRRFVVDLTDGADLNDLKGQRIRVTLVGSESQSEAAFDMVEDN